MEFILVTGGAGFIGSHLTACLIKKNYQVRILDNFISGSKQSIPKEVDLIEGDIGDLNTCHQAMKNVTAVFHCAAMSRVLSSAENVSLYTHSNIVGMQNILQAAASASVKKVIYSGSSTFYGNQAPPHLENTTQNQFLNFYAYTKAVGEQYCLLYDKLFNLPCVVLRYFNVYGPRQPEEGPYGLVLGIFLRALRNQESLMIHGDGLQRRDFIHVDDVVAANIAAFENNIRGEILNVGSGTNISIKELANLISKNQQHVARRLGDADETLADISKIRSLLSWEPKVRFEDGLRELLT